MAPSSSRTPPARLPSLAAPPSRVLPLARCCSCLLVCSADDEDFNADEEAEGEEEEEEEEAGARHAALLPPKQGCSCPSLSHATFCTAAAAEGEDEDEEAEYQDDSDDSDDDDDELVRRCWPLAASSLCVAHPHSGELMAASLLLARIVLLSLKMHCTADAIVRDCRHQCTLTNNCTVLALYCIVPYCLPPCRTRMNRMLRMRASCGPW